MTFRSNIELLTSYKSRSNPNNDKIDIITDLYKDKTIPNIKTAENAVVLLSSTHKATIPKALASFNKLVSKYSDAEPITGRLSRQPFCTVSIKKLDKPITHVQFNIRTSNRDRFDNAEDGAEKLTFEEVFKQIKGRLIKETAAVLKHKQSMS